MTKDNFWKLFWLSSVGMTLLCGALGAMIFFAYIGSIDTNAVGVNYVPDKDPFKTNLHGASYAVTGGYIYKDSLPLGISQWAWDATVDWRSKEQILEGSYAVKATITKAWGGVGVGGFNIDPRTNKTLLLAVYPDQNVGDLYLELYDQKGMELVRQSVGWYAVGGTLVPNQWQVVSIPVHNLSGSSSPSSLTALSVSATNPGAVYIDALQFSDAPVEHPAWVYREPDIPEAVAYVPPPFNPFATSTVVSLPYNLKFSPNWNDQWYSTRGLFEQQYDNFKLGPEKGVGQDALAFFRGGKTWADYQVTAKVAWGGAGVFALLVRMQDESNYVSCSFSGAGDTVQMYSVKDGVSTMVTQSDKLHYSDYRGGVTGAGALVQGNTLSCGVDGKSILTETIPDMPAQGTVGMEAWDQSDAATAHTIESFKVSPLVGE